MQEKPLAEKARRRNAGQMIFGRQRHVKWMKAEWKPTFNGYSEDAKCAGKMTFWET
jgi:hypothetical protein